MTVYRLETSLQEAPGIARRLTSAAWQLVNWFIRLHRTVQARRAVRGLLAYDDQLLSDIGVTRGDVVSAMSGPVFEDAGRRLSRIAHKRQYGDRTAVNLSTPGEQI